MEWDPNFLARSPMFEPLRAHAPESFPATWPELPMLQRLLERREPLVRVASGLPLRVVPQPRGARRAELSYEERIYSRGELQVRPGSWHDLFNFLVWLSFPQAKAALNARHWAASRARASTGAANRGPVEDALTLFDEGGVVVAAAAPALIERLRAFEWKDLFWRRRIEVARSMRFWLFGHALYEKALHPFAGITGRGICFEIDAGFLQAPSEIQLDELDRRLAAHIGDPGRLTATRGLAHVPILGVPGWCPDNEVESYYDNTDYFRPATSNRGNRRDERSTQRGA
jgi:hypothetical protein